MKLTHRGQFTCRSDDELGMLTFVMKKTQYSPEVPMEEQITVSISVKQFKQFFKTCRKHVRWLSVEFENEVYYWSEQLGWHRCKPKVIKEWKLDED